MTCVIRIVALAAAGFPEQDRQCMGKYLETFDVDAFDGRGDATLTEHKSHALQFPDFSAAMAAWRMRSTVRPTRPDGRPNRPLTAWSVEIEAV